MRGAHVKGAACDTRDRQVDRIIVIDNRATNSFSALLSMIPRSFQRRALTVHMFAARALKRNNNGVQSELVTGRMRGLRLPMCVVCTLTSISMTALVLFTTPYYNNSAQRIPMDCAAATSNSQQSVTPLQGVAARYPRSYLSEPLNNSFVSSKGRRSEPACAIDHKVVLNFSRCHLSCPFLVYLYNSHFPDLFQLKYPTVLTEWETHINSMTSNPSEACVFIAVVGPLRNEISKSDLENKIRSLPYWDNGGVNHVLIDLSDTGRTSTLLNELNPCNAIIASTSASHNRQLNHILAPPILPVIKEESITESHTIIRHASILPVWRELFVYFEGNLVNSDEDVWQIGQVEQFRQSVYRLKKHNHIQVKCGRVQNSALSGAMDGEWALCDSWLSPQSHYHHANFSLIPGASHGRAGAVTYARLINSLRCGSIPVVIGVNRLPFDEVINWRRAAISLPSLLMTDALYIMSAMTEDEIMGYRRQGRFLFETYFASHKRILDSILAIVRYRFFHPPPPATEFIGTSLVITGKHNKIEPSLLNNFLHSAISVYTEKLWNEPPGPFHVYPVTPFKPVSMSHYSSPGSVTRDESLLRAEFVGASFRKHLRGDYAEEGFTIVTLTYHRNEQLLKMLALFEGCPYLAKVVVVWNNEEDPPRSMMWPNIGVPIEVRDVLRACSPTQVRVYCFHVV